MNIIECVEHLLEISWKLERFKVVKPGRLYNFRCPFCGDSKKNPLKARGYMYEHPEKSTLYYKCHNCGLSASFLRFLKLFDETYYNSLIFNKKYKEDPDPLPVQLPTKKEEPVLSKTYEREMLESAGAKPLSDLYGINQLATIFINKRRLPKDTLEYLYYTETFNDFIHKLEPKYEKNTKNDPRIILPFFHKGFKFDHLQGRALLNSEPRYYSVSLIKKGLPRIYGLYKDLDAYDEIYVIEGPIDSLFIPNAIAIGGSELKAASSYFPEEKLVFVFDNEPENPEIVKKMSSIIQRGDKIVIWPKELEGCGKDINEMILHGISSDEIKDFLKKNTFQGLAAEAQFGFWKISK